MTKKKPVRWGWWLLGQWILLAILSGLVPVGTLMMPGETAGAAYSVGMWAALPLIGALTAYGITVKGVNQFLSWIAPPVTMTALHWLALDFPPESAGMPLLAAFLALVGASAGEVVRVRRARSKR